VFAVVHLLVGLPRMGVRYRGIAWLPFLLSHPPCACVVFDTCSLLLLPPHHHFSQASLGRVLKAYAIYEPEVGYCQGMGFLVALLLMYMQEEDAFWCLVQICDGYDMYNIFRAGLPKVIECLYVFERLLHHFLPKLNSHLVCRRSLAERERVCVCVGTCVLARTLCVGVLCGW
jgi:Rab-GTPase-TBC domain